MSHKEKCCDPTLKAIAKKSNNAKLPGSKGACVGANRFLVPSKRKAYHDGLKKKLGEKAKLDLIDACSRFPANADYRNPGVDASDPFARVVPFLDGEGNLLGTWEGASSGVKVNWGMIKRMPRYDVRRLRDRDGDPNFWKADHDGPSAEYVYAFATRARYVWRTKWLPPKEQAKADKKAGSPLPEPEKAARLADAESRGYTKPIFARMKDKSAGASGWIPRSAIAGATDPKSAVFKLFECSKDCMAELRVSRSSGFHGPTVPYHFVDLHAVTWTKSEFHRGHGLADVAPHERQKQFGPDWIASDMTGVGWQHFKHVGDGKLTNADVMERAYVEKILGKTSTSAKRKKQLLFEEDFHAACIYQGKKKSESNDQAGDYLARNLTSPRELRVAYLLWAIPGSGGVAMDTFPLGTTFHRLPNVKKQKNPTVKRSAIYVRKNGKMVATNQRLTWFYGFISYPTGHGRTAHAYGWVLKNAVQRSKKPKTSKKEKKPKAEKKEK